MVEARVLFALPLLGLIAQDVGCARAQNGRHLQVAVDDYHHNLRWKRLQSAAAYRHADHRAEFLARYLAVEDRLSIDRIDVRGVTLDLDADPPEADVVVVAEAVLLPSDILQKHVITEHWELVGEHWHLVNSSLELAPPIEEKIPK